MLIHAPVIITSGLPRNQIMIFTKTLKDHVPTIDNTKKSTKDALGNKEPAEKAGRLRGLKLGSEHAGTRIPTVIDFPGDRLMAIA
jgi:hypothetical protein